MPLVAVVRIAQPDKNLSLQFSSFAEWSGVAYADQLPTIIVAKSEKNASLKMLVYILQLVQLPLKIYPPAALRIVVG